MTSRERLLTVLRKGVPDRVPVSIYEHSILSDNWANREPSYAPLLELERRYGDSFVRAPVGVPVLIGDPNAARADDVPSSDGSLVRTNEIETPKGKLRSVSRRDPGLMTYWQIEPLIKSDADIERVLAMPDPPPEIDTKQLRDLQARVGDSGVLLFSIGDAIGHVVGLFDFEDFITRCIDDDGPIRALLDKAQHQILTAIRAHDGVITNAIFRFWGPEYCGAPLMDPHRSFPRYVMPYDQQATEAAHATGNFSMIHCHGRLRDILDMIADTGVDALEPLETLPLATADVTLQEIKQRVGHRMCLMGSIQAVTLEAGTPAEMRDQVKASIETGGPGGGFVLLPTAAPFMVPLEPHCLANAEAMYLAAHEYGQYS